ncbi:hypothetical protein XthCFBP4691_09755 [Xanthomonas theicola]|uniref:Uncharacterized protein n=1 Tax=Xanthomonas theicola TaxID=56464 RepID=A0A2S6ZFG6_9XANT|nr:hypothetical protein XthCFBP4691_09755 [Xanthomonas theicola]
MAGHVRTSRSSTAAAATGGLIEKRQQLRVPRERIAGFEPAAPAPAVPGTAPQTGGINGKRPSRKDARRAANAQGGGGSPCRIDRGRGAGSRPLARADRARLPPGTAAPAIVQGARRARSQGTRRSRPSRRMAPGHPRRGRRRCAARPQASNGSAAASPFGRGVRLPALLRIST